MDLDRVRRAETKTRLLIRDGLARQQWEAVLADRDSSAWPSRRFCTWPELLGACFDSVVERGLEPQVLILSTNQTERLWRRVIENSESGRQLIAAGGVARWARQGRRSLLEHGALPSDQKGASWHGDSRIFLSWNRQFEAELKRNDWIDPDSLLYRINRLPAELVACDLILLDPPRPTPEMDSLIQAWRAAGSRIDCIEPDDYDAAIEAVVAPDPAGEIRLAADWAADRLRGAADRRFAIVVPDLKSRLEEVETALTDRLDSTQLSSTVSRPVGDVAILGAALTALELIGGGEGFDRLGRWLRSPFFVSDDPNRTREAAALEIEWRKDPRAQRDFADAWRHLGLGSRLARGLPDLAQRLDRVFDRMPRRATPTGWTAAWQSSLRLLGWQGFETGLPARLQSAWDNAWARFAELTAIVGTVDNGTALELFDEIVASERIYEPMALTGVVLMEHPAQVGPGFDGVWMTGCSDETLMAADAPNPLLPWRIQAELGMPGSNPEIALAAATDDLARLRRRVPEARFSCPGRVGDEPRLPSPLLDRWQPAPASGLSCGATAGRIGTRSWEQLDDPAPPLAGERIPGGTRTLDLQACCPVRAFCAARLRALPLAPPERGVDPRLRGLLVHRALELLLDPDRPAAGIPASVEAAVAELTRPGDACWSALLGAERSRIERLIEKLMEIEAGRSPFATIAVEHRTQVRIDGRRLDCRIDRVDRLAAGDTLLIDYKTARSPRVGWFEPRLDDCQLPVYALDSTPAAIATIRLRGDRVDYRWAGRELALPGKVQSFDEAGWQTQLDRWRQQIGELLAEFVGGDVRVPADAAEHVGEDGRDRAGGAFAPLTRVGDIR